MRLEGGSIDKKARVITAEKLGKLSLIEVGVRLPHRLSFSERLPALRINDCMMSNLAEASKNSGFLVFLNPRFAIGTQGLAPAASTGSSVQNGKRD